MPSDFIAFSSSMSMKKKSVRDYKEMLSTQFPNFKQDRNGKFSGKGGGGNDDLLISLAMTTFWMSRFSASINPEYMSFKRRYDPDMWILENPGKVLQIDKEWENN